MFSTQAHIFEIDPQTKKKWLPTSSNAVKVAFYHDPGRKTYRIISIESSKVSITVHESSRVGAPAFCYNIAIMAMFSLL